MYVIVNMPTSKLLDIEILVKCTRAWSKTNFASKHQGMIGDKKWMKSTCDCKHMPIAKLLGREIGQLYKRRRLGQMKTSTKRFMASVCIFGNLYTKEKNIQNTFSLRRRRTISGHFSFVKIWGRGDTVDTIQDVTMVMVRQNWQTYNGYTSKWCLHISKCE